ncbi:iron reductase [Rhodosalinus halophilus]|uniref:Iron reductase n=1 Tax=Rhodosalinus halophilus TaxID=2259333 RepID=A0A365UDV2_9RHOB|nr:ferric reductase-like transmembrane domain-containing protein [Rhodosalinus halophilus]RBI87457.1 iron reductase [Rhodosalinus halophilus]
MTAPQTPAEIEGAATTREASAGRRGARIRISAAWLAALYPGVCLAPLALSFLRPVAPAHAWELAAAGLGIAALAAMAVQFVTSGRFEAFTGALGIDRIMAFHKVAAWWVLLALLLHPVAYVVPTWLDDPALAMERMVAYLTLPHYRSGVVALAALLAVVLLADLRERLPWPYELWRASHLLLAIVALGGGLHHAVHVGRFSAEGPVELYWWAVGAAALAALATLYGWRWLRLHRRPWRLASVTTLADRLWEMDIQPVEGTPALPYAAGQFVWMTVGGRRFPLFDHPFSIADSPLRPGVSLIVKEAGDFTDTVGTLAPGTPVGIDGPYGDFTLEAHRGDGVLLLAAGAGIAPIMGLLRDLAARRDPRPVRLGYAAGRPANMGCLDEIAGHGERLDLDSLLVVEEGGPGWRGETGLLDRSRLSRLLEGLDPEQCVAMICGPGPMVTAVCDTLLELGVPMECVIYERFDYAGGRSRQDHRRMRRFLGLGAALALGVAAFVAMAA